MAARLRPIEPPRNARRRSDRLPFGRPNADRHRGVLATWHCPDRETDVGAGRRAGVVRQAVEVHLAVTGDGGFRAEHAVQPAEERGERAAKPVLNDRQRPALVRPALPRPHRPRSCRRSPTRSGPAAPRRLHPRAPRAPRPPARSRRPERPRLRPSRTWPPRGSARAQQVLSEQLRHVRLADAVKAPGARHDLTAEASRSEPGQGLVVPHRAHLAGGPGSVTTTRPSGASTSQPGAVPFGFGSASADGIRQACLRLTSGKSMPRRSNRSRSHASISGSTVGSSPTSAATASRVRSSGVGPRPPVVRTRSARPSAASSAPRTTSRSSGMACSRSTCTPRAVRSRASSPAFVSRVSPTVISLPTLSSSAVSRRPAGSGDVHPHEGTVRDRAEAGRIVAVRPVRASKRSVPSGRRRRPAPC